MLRTFFIAIFALGLLTSMLSHCASSRSSRGADAFAERPRVIDLGNSSGEAGSSGGMTVSEGEVDIQRNSDGHFYADVQINGSPVHALVDTGASAIALSRSDASAAGLATSI